MQMLRIKRTYDPPARGDGRRILVERLWPRGMKTKALAADAWMKEVAPSTELTTSFTTAQWFCSTIWWSDRPGLRIAGSRRASAHLEDKRRKEVLRW